MSYIWLSNVCKKTKMTKKPCLPIHLGQIISLRGIRPFTFVSKWFEFLSIYVYLHLLKSKIDINKFAESNKSYFYLPNIRLEKCKNLFSSIHLHGLGSSCGCIVCLYMYFVNRGFRLSISFLLHVSKCVRE